MEEGTRADLWRGVGAEVSLLRGKMGSVGRK